MEREVVAFMYMSYLATHSGCDSMRRWNVVSDKDGFALPLYDGELGGNDVAVFGYDIIKAQS